jgi:Ca2+:H+ antiporter
LYRQYANNTEPTDHIRSWARQKAHGQSPLSQPRRTPANTTTSNNAAAVTTERGADANPLGTSTRDNTTTPRRPADTPANNEAGILESSTTSDVSGKSNNKDAKNQPKKNIVARFFLTTKDILLSSYINVLLVFVPIGIAAEAAHLKAAIIFSMNAIAIIPLAGLLSHATESVAKRMGDTIGALMNVTFGNAVELIIFIIALTKNEIRIVQASLIGSILANLLLILGMAFFLGGLRFREQVYNSTVTQMSACLLSLSVISLLLPTAFHASFQDGDKADDAVVKVSRGTSVILLIVYGLYLLFQLRSHAYMYESTPQHIIDEVSVPGPGANWLDSSSSDDSSSSSESDASSSHRKRIKKMLKHRRRRSSTTSSKNDLATIASTSAGTAHDVEAPQTSQELNEKSVAIDGEPVKQTQDTEKSNEGLEIANSSKKQKKSKRHEKHSHRGRQRSDPDLPRELETTASISKASPAAVQPVKEGQQVNFANVNTDIEAQRTTASRPFNFRAISRPALPKVLSQNVFTQPPQRDTIQRDTSRAPAGHATRKTRSLPQDFEATPHGVAPVHQPRPFISFASPEVDEPGEKEEENISKTTAIILLLVSTGLVALCADFMVEAIDAVTTGTGVSATFVGLIILPVVGNAAEHVTAVTVAIKNKMDLSIGVAVGSSIQIGKHQLPCTFSNTLLTRCQHSSLHPLSSSWVGAWAKK